MARADEQEQILLEDKNEIWRTSKKSFSQLTENYSVQYNHNYGEQFISLIDECAVRSDATLIQMIGFQFSPTNWSYTSHHNSLVYSL